ncbi:MAG: AAA family ATPase [Acidobacteriota bacterium]|nr:AAA family ATPase [Acidobacteriota bacterium]
MLWLERLEVSGFKSFSDKSTIEFPRGITAVVGPNGCGKSNIADAISWVLGEQSARALRGQKMEDVIFAGTQGRGPGGMAEVSLHMAAKNGSLPDGRSRVTLTRRLFRSGNSEYLIDGKKSRLADVRALLDQVRAGVRSYAIIDQGSVASFVLSKPKDRRVFIEEAAGIAGYKTRRRMAELKLEATRANLLRIDDIVGEVERQQRSLKRQASLARRARRLDERLRALKTVWYRRRDAVLAAEAQRSAELCAVASREADHLDRERRRLLEALADARRRLEDAHTDREQAVAASHAARIEEERLDREIAAALTRAASLEEEAGRREGEGDRLIEERAQRAEEIARLEEEIRSLAGELTELTERTAAARRVVEREKAELERRRQVAASHEQALYDRVHRKAELSARASAALAAERRDERRAEEARQAGERLAEVLESEGRQLAAAEQRRKEAEACVTRLEVELERARDAEDDCWTALERARADETALVRELGARSGEKDALDSLEVRLAGAEAAREILEHSREGKLQARQVVAELLAVEKDVEHAAERFLGDLLPAVVVDSSDDVQKGASLGVGGRVRFLPLDDTAAEGVSHGELPAALAAHPRCAGPALRTPATAG